MITAVAAAIRATQHIPFDWKFSGALFAFSAMALAIAMLLASKRGGSAQQQVSGVQTVAVLAGGGPASVNIQAALASAYNSVLQAEFEAAFRAGLNAYPQNEREPTLIKLMATGTISYMYDRTWWTIYKSQLLALQELNSKILRREQVEAYYDAAADRYPEQYAHYSFEQWLSYMKGQVLILDQPGDAIGITVRGKDFLKYMVHCGYSVNARPL